MGKEDELVQQISEKSDRFGDKLIDFMDRYGLSNLREATIEQLEEYLRGI